MCRRRIQRRVARDLVRAGLSIDDLRVVDADGPRHTFRLRKHGRSLVITANCGAMASHAGLAGVFRNRSLAIVDPFLRSPATEAVGEVSDGEESGPGTISFSATDPAAILIPDSIFYRSRGYDYLRDAADRWQVDWAARKERIVWRGSTTGRGRISSEEMAASDPSLILRTRMCLMLRATPDVDARLINVVQSAEPARDKLRLEQADIFGNFIHPRTWCVRKFAIDVDGNSNAWSNLFTRLLAGCCVVKIASPSGYRQWYYDALRPWEHFVPVNADLSDLHEKIDWCRTHDRQCAEIAAAGRDFAVRRDFETEIRGAVETLNARLAAT
jgi:Glycosyl transferase family 90